MADIAAYAEFLLTASASLLELKCVEITHDEFEQSFRYVQNDFFGVTVQHEDGLECFYAYEQLGIVEHAIRNDLDQKLSLTIVDYDDRLIEAIENITNGVAPCIQLRKYRSDDLNTPIYSSGKLDIGDISKDSFGKVTFDAASASLSDLGTGELYTLENSPLLRGALK